MTTKLGDRERRLATIMVADIVGYSRLMDADEEGTYTALRAARAEVIDPKIEEQGGRIVKHLGDGFLAEFPTVMAAIQFAMSFQEEMGRRAQGVPKDRQIKLRIGVNLGDVIVDEDGDIFGDGVNVAARLEALAIPGGICISSPVYETVNKQLDVGFDDLIRQIYAAKSTRFQKMIHDGELKLRPGVKRILEAARELEIPLAVATTTNPGNVTSLLASNLGEESIGWFSVIAAGDMVASKKPAPDIYQYALNAMGIGPQGCVALEDSANGLRSSLAAGLPTLISVTDYTADEDFTGAALVVNHFGDPGNPAAIIQNPGEIPFDRMVDLEVLKHVAHRIN